MVIRDTEFLGCSGVRSPPKGRHTAPCLEKVATETTGFSSQETSDLARKKFSKSKAKMEERIRSRKIDANLVPAFVWARLAEP